jgi:hypothetical protein
MVTPGHERRGTRDGTACTHERPRFRYGLEPALSYSRKADLVPAGACPAEPAEDPGGVSGKTAGVKETSEAASCPGMKSGGFCRADSRQKESACRNLTGLFLRAIGGSIEMISI